METSSPRTLFVYFDESGNLDFSTRGTEHFVLTAFCTFDPLSAQKAMMELAHELVCQGLGQEYFHATEDAQSIRDKVFSCMVGLREPLVLHSSIARKRKVPPALRDTDLMFYNYLVSRALRNIVTSPQFKDVEQIVVVFSSLFTKKDAGAMIGAAKSELKKAVSIPCWVYSHAAKAHHNCQIADYACWAVYIKYAKNEMRSHQLIERFLESEEQLFPDEGPSYY